LPQSGGFFALGGGVVVPRPEFCRLRREGMLSLVSLIQKTLRITKTRIFAKITNVFIRFVLQKGIFCNTGLKNPFMAQDGANPNMLQEAKQAQNPWKVLVFYPGS